MPQKNPNKAPVKVGTKKRLRLVEIEKNPSIISGTVPKMSHFEVILRTPLRTKIS